MLSSGGGSWHSLLQLTKFLTHELLFQTEIPTSWSPISLNNSMMQKMQMSSSSHFLCRTSLRVTKCHDLGFWNLFRSLDYRRSWKARTRHCLWNQHLSGKWHHLTHYQQGPNSYTSSELTRAQSAMKVRGKTADLNLKCSLIEAHQAQFQPCAGAGNRERQHWVLQGQRACAPVSPHAVLPQLPEGLGTCSSNECELNECRQEKTPLTLLRLLWKLLRASEEAAGVYLFFNTYPRNLFLTLHIYICLHISLSLHVLVHKYSFKFLQSSPYCHTSATMLAGPAPRVVWQHSPSHPFSELNRTLHFSASSRLFFDVSLQHVHVFVSPVHCTGSLHTKGKQHFPKSKSMSKLGTTSFFLMQGSQVATEQTEWP